MTLVELLEKNAKELPDKSAVIWRSVKMSYAELNGNVNRLANALLGMGVAKGERVGFMLPRVPELVISFLGVAKAGAIGVPISTELPDDGIRALFETIVPKCVIVHASFLEVAKRSLAHAEGIPTIVVGRSDEECLLWDEVLAGGKASNPCLGMEDGDVVYLNYTSGSTGESKGAMTTHSNIYWNTLASVDALGLTGEDVHLCMFAAFAHPHEIIARPLYLGGTIVLVDKIYPKSLAEAISKHKVTCMMGLAPMYESLLAVRKLKAYDFGSLKIPESGGMYTSPGLIERFRKEVGVSVIPVWGSTETTGVALANRPGERIMAGSMGRVCASYEVKIVDESGSEVEAGETGEMIFRGPAVVSEYWENAAVNGECFHNGWYHSGDLARKDGEGNFYFMARKTEMMKVAGLKVYPLEIEIVSAEHPGIKEAAVVPAKDKLRGEVPKAVIVAHKGVKISKEEIVRFWRERLAHYKVPRIVQIRDSLPRMNGSGKIDKSVLRLETL